MRSLIVFAFLFISLDAYSLDSFSTLVPRAQPVRFATGAENVRSIGCTNGTFLTYVDLNGSKLTQNQFEPIVSKFFRIGSGSSNVISSYLTGNTTQTAGQIESLTLSYLAWGTNSTTTGTYPVLYDHLSLQYRFLGNTAELEVTNRSHQYGTTYSVPGGSFTCELFAEPYYLEPISQRVYDCPGNVSFYLKRNYGAENVVRLGSGANSKIMRLQNAFVNNYSWFYSEEYNSSGRSSTTNFRTPEGSTTWNQVLSANPPLATFTMNGGSCALRR